ncbi:metal-sensitive transcriptional regulator [Candidatus Gracilibacteria bacterium]|nr:metal-sensitive transcriptional regulator [Candidatus Gracilibacteria bacterium]
MTPYKSKLQTNIRKAEGTLKKVAELIEQDAYCADIAHQVNATMGLLQSLNRELLKHHLASCGSTKLANNYPEKDIFIEELVRTWDVATRK